MHFWADCKNLYSTTYKVAHSYAGKIMRFRTLAVIEFALNATDLIANEESHSPKKILTKKP